MTIENKTPCTCGVGTMFWAHLHEDSCPYSKDGDVAPESPSERRISELEAEVARLSADRLTVGESRQILEAFKSPLPNRYTCSANLVTKLRRLSEPNLTQSNLIPE